MGYIIYTSVIVLFLLYFGYIKRKNSPKYKRNKKISKAWEENWNNFSKKDIFNEFRIYRFGYGSSLSDIKRRYKNNMDFWVQYNIYVQKQKNIKEEEVKVKKITQELNDMLSNISKDFNNSHRNGNKVSTRREGYDSHIEVTYRFDNGDIVVMEGRTLVYTNYTHKIKYTLGHHMRSTFVDLFNSIILKINDDSKYNRNGNNYNYDYYGDMDTKFNNPVSKDDHPKRSLYNTLKNTVDQRERQLKDGKYNMENKESLVNELDNAKRKLKDIKDKYNF